MSKASNLSKMKNEGIRVPNFINITNLDCTEEEFYEWVGLFNSNLRFSVRSSGSISTPGRMETLLNVLYGNLWEAFNTVKKSLTSESVRIYLKAKGVVDFKASIIIQEMITVHKNGHDCSGVLTTIHPITGKDIYYGNVIFGQQGDKVMNGSDKVHPLFFLQEHNLTGYYNLMAEVRKIQDLYSEPQEIEFTIKNDVAYILQTRNFNKLTSTANTIEYIKDNYIGSGEAATNLSLQAKCTTRKDQSKGKILITLDTNFEDTELLINCAGIITLNGGILSHAAMIAREFNIPCIVGSAFKENPKEGQEIIMHNTGAITKL